MMSAKADGSNGIPIERRRDPKPSAPDDGFSRLGIVLHRHRHQPPLDCDCCDRRRERRRYMADCMVRVLPAACALSDGAFLALPAGGWPLRMVQARLRRITWLHHRLDVLG